MFITVYSDICFEDRVKLLNGALKYVLALISATETVRYSLVRMVKTTSLARPRKGSIKERCLHAV